MGSKIVPLCTVIKRSQENEEENNNTKKQQSEKEGRIREMP